VAPPSSPPDLFATPSASSSLHCEETYSEFSKHVMRVVASVGLDTRMGIVCLGLCPETNDVFLDLQRLRLALDACCSREDISSYATAQKEFIKERKGSLKSGRVYLTGRDLDSVRKSSDSIFQCSPEERLVQIKKNPKEIIRILRSQADKEPSVAANEQLPRWGKPLLLDTPFFQRTLPEILSKIVGRNVCFSPYHVQAGIWPTLQRVRSSEEYERDIEQVGSLVEELEIAMKGRSVTRPPTHPDEAGAGRIRDGG